MTNLAHVNIRTANLDESVAFYRDVLGFMPAPAATRPESPDHVWMSDDRGRPCIHLQLTEKAARGQAEDAGVHHVALECSNPGGWRRKLRSMNIDFDEAEFAHARLTQLNLRDPDGVRLELLFEHQ